MIDESLFNEFVQNRIDMKKPMTERAKAMLVKKLNMYEKQGYCPNLLLNRSIYGGDEGWKGIYPHPSCLKSNFENQPHLIPLNWQPAQMTLDVLRDDGIPESFTLGQVKEFILYWTERRTMDNKWNSVFISRVRFLWEKKKKSDSLKSKDSMGFVERHTDKSWRHLNIGI